MRKVCCFILITLLISVVLMPTVAYAVPYSTFTSGPEGQTVPTQTAYTPLSKVAFSGDNALDNPQDMCYCEVNNTLYIADTGNGRVIVSSIEGQVKAVIGEGTMSSPSGITVSDGKIYVADKGNKLIYVYDGTTYDLLKTIDKPLSPLVGTQTPFVPSKLQVDSRGNIYVVSDGSVNGVMQLNMEGEFIANVGANKTQVSLKTILQQIFFSDEQVKAFLATPRSPTNIAINSKGLLYTVTTNATQRSIQKLNSQGTSIMVPETVNHGSTVAVTIDNDDNIYGVDTDGYITIYDSYGDIIFIFGGKDSRERLGNLSGPVAIAVLPDNDLLVLDKDYNMVIRYTRTDFAKLVFGAVEYYKDGLYIDGEADWQKVLQYNSNFTISYKALARANMKKGNYELALQQFKLAEDKEGYSDAYWQIRNDWLQKNIGWAVGIILVIIALLVTYRIIDKKNKTLFLPLKNTYNKVMGVGVIKQLAHGRRFVKSTADAVYEVKYHNAASVTSATILYAWFVVLQILSVLVKGYLFNDNTVYNTRAGEIILYSTLPLIMLVLCNYFVSTVTDGEGKLKYCYIVFIYALMPYLVLALPTFIVSNFITYNEQILYTALCIVMYAWSAINVFVAIMELHDYNLWQTIKNVLLTVFAFCMAILFVVILRMLATQLFGYFAELFGEIFRRA